MLDVPLASSVVPTVVMCLGEMGKMTLVLIQQSLCLIGEQQLCGPIKDVLHNENFAVGVSR